jgi:membrane associated rhomboid family serine protease
VIPLRDDNPTANKTWVTWALIVLTSLVWVVLQPHGSQQIVDVTPKSTLDFGQSAAGRDLAFSLGWAAVPCEVTQGRPLSEGEVRATFENGQSDSCNRPKQAVTAALEVFPKKSILLSILVSIFLHGGLLHLAGNMLFLFIFGNNIEDRWGRVPFIIFYLASGVVATLAHVFADRNSTIPVIGASGAIAGVMGAYLVLFPKAKVTAILPIFVIGMMTRLPAWVVLAVWFVSQFFIAPNSGVAWVAHVGGFIFGAFIALLDKARPRPALTLR